MKPYYHRDRRRFWREWGLPFFLLTVIGAGTGWLALEAIDQHMVEMQEVYGRR